ncbi:uncharacterized protein N7529_001229 [Penicillium soppii]|jgi:hypothetical protein|uniref:uncharacterized protein n=1 Tax=Penicillium soppii TaxID=69789 RepID=UPI002546BC41|nr:uncharacterized protein N7529_001229 [Penicillium soppii]KAJ5882557.1 hypothetical protein N7529_001229 [Penicillium soppii]
MAELTGKRERRKSLSVFSPLSNPRPPLHDRTPSDDTLNRDKKPRRNSGFFSRSNNDFDGSNPRRPGTAGSDTAAWSSAAVAASTPVIEPPRPRRKSLQKKRTSVFGSLKSLHSWEDDEMPSASVASVDDQIMSNPRNGIWSSAILHHGEVQTTGGMWRKKSQYLVLTDTHIIRFKSQGKAADAFPSIPASYTRAPAAHRQSVASISSLQDMTQMASGDATAGIPLNSIIAVYMLEDARLSPSVEVAYLDERTHKATLVQMQTSDLQDLNLWMVGIRQAAQMARANHPMPFSRGSVEYVTRMLEHERDYDPEAFRMFRVIQIASSKSITRASSDDLTKLSPTGCYLAIGSHKLHLLPMQKTANRSSVVSLSDWESATSFGLMNLTGLSMEYGDDSLHLTFRVPLKKSYNVFLASVHSVEVACWIRQHTEYLRPLWTRQPYEFVVPKELQNEDNFPPVPLDEDYGCLDRTLVAYSASYDIDTSNIRYTIDLECEDAPCFRLLKPASSKSSRYTALELIAVMRTLRYNEFFRSISFRGVNLDSLQGLRDSHGVDADVHLDRGGTFVHIPGQHNLTVLSQEVRALALKSKWLRRLDFSYCLTRVPTPTLEKGTRDPGCGIPEAIFPVCRRELTSVDWVVLNGIKLGESDLDYLVDAASQRRSHLRALEVGDCGLSVHDLDLLLSTIVAQESTLEAINISGVQGRLNPDVLQQYIGYFGQIRKINLSRISRTSGTDPLITAEMLFNWRLEELALSRTAVNRETVDAIATYLASDRSRNLRVVRLDQCGLTGEDVAMFMHSMSAMSSEPRSLHLHVNENRLDNGCSYVFSAIVKNQTPSHLSMRMIDFKKEEHFRELVESLRKNTTLQFLDISKASLPYDASPETCRSLQLMLEENETLEALDISGDNAHLDVARFGIGLNLALTGLKKNKSLKVLRIEHQKLGLQGANTLASVLEENDSLREVHCENNDINLQSFTVLVNGLQCNRALLTLSCMDRDRTASLDKVRREVDNVRWEASNNQNSTANSIRRSLYAAMSVGQGQSGHRLHKAPPPTVTSATDTSPFANHNVELVLESLNKKWDMEVARLRRYLLRNYNIAHGVEEDDIDDSASDGRPATAASLGTMLDNLKFDVAVSTDEINTPEEPASIRLSETSDTTSLSLSPTTSATPKSQPSKPRPQTARAPNIPPSEYGSASTQTLTSNSRLALPVPAVPSAVRKASSVRSAHSSSSTISTGTGSGRSAYGTASSTLRGFLSGTALRERRRADARTERPPPNPSAPVYVSNDKPPQLDWAPPKLDLGELQ